MKSFRRGKMDLIQEAAGVEKERLFSQKIDG